ncbi:MAG: hydroxymethylglutaryl-CoA lyase [Proteobacteria bacterium]|nr:hydroxymethylglutaryl-CoA lyase [Pseudomonadota bacterium]
MTIDVVVREVGMRDGLQSIPDIMPTATKKTWCTAEAAAGMPEIEVSSFVPPKLLPQLADASEIVAHALTIPKLTVAALIPNLKGAERGITTGVHKLNYVMSVSEGHNQSNVRRSCAQSMEDFARVVDLCAAAGPKRPKVVGCLATAFGCTIEGKVDEDRVRRFAAEFVAAGADEIVVADTVGYGNPAAVGRVFTAVIAEVGSLPVAAHFHDTRGLGLANVHAAVEAGVRAFDASLGGFGGCPYAPGATGNIVMEDLVFLLEAMGLKTGVDLDKLIGVREILKTALPNLQLYGNMAKAGLPKNFARAA